MKKINYIISAFFIALLVNCTGNDNEVLNESNIAHENLNTYKGILVNNRLNAPIIDSDNKTLARKESAKTINLEDFSLDQIAKAVEEELAKFPYIKEGDNVTEKVELLRKDFPTLSDEDIQKNINVIEEYYHQSLDYLVYKKLSDQARESSKITKNDYGSAQVDCIDNKGVFRSYGGSFGSRAMALAAFYQAGQAKNIAAAEYPSLASADTKHDAYRHILWSALLCRYYYTVSSKAPKLSYAKTVTDAWEECGNNEKDAMYMDYHNNEIGRRVYDRNTPYEKFLGFVVGLKTPSVDLLKQKTKEEVEKAFYVTGTTQERADKIRTKTYNCVTKYHRRSRYICDDNFDSGFLPNPTISDFDDRETRIVEPDGPECWETYYEAYQSCDGTLAVYISQ
ncbi:DUF6973 domain-containing protein [Tenacibaculum amylolyticum]|uniref:DUF6973 domain-containing protein n=1 Tax=Tenacibaculum amylolyticum TaxID=104269 RepID=UPI003895EC59